MAGTSPAMTTPGKWPDMTENTSARERGGDVIQQSAPNEF
jgi:hypothetical protein